MVQELDADLDQMFADSALTSNIFDQLYALVTIIGGNLWVLVEVRPQRVWLILCHRDEILFKFLSGGSHS